MSDVFKPAFGVASIIWLDAMIMLDELCSAGATKHGTHKCLDSKGNIDPVKLIAAWESVLDTNYESVFRPAILVLPDTIPPNKLKKVFTRLHQQAHDIAMSNLGETASIGGEIYAKALGIGQRKRTAAYYTRPEVAEYLAVMTIPDVDEMPEDVETWRVADFACGTGTLLRAAYRRLRQFALAKQTPIQDFHKHMMQSGLCGLDISIIASHLTTTGLVSLQPEVSYKDTSIGAMPVGKRKGAPSVDIDSVATGSLELAVEKAPRMFFDSYVATQGEQISENSKPEPRRLDADNESFDAVIMNPPYSRTRKDQVMFDIAGLTQNEIRLAQNRTQRKIRPKCGGSMKAGLGSLFTHISDMKLKHGGRLGLVLPLSMAAQGSWRETRELIAQNYSDITITYFSSAPKGKEVSMSADTNMGEMMLTARKGDKGRTGIVYACIFEPFSFASQAAETARALLSGLNGRKPGDHGGISMAEDHVGNWYWEPSTEGIWSGAGATQITTFLSQADRLIKGLLETTTKSHNSFPVSRIGKIFEVGPSHDSIGHPSGGDGRGVFVMYEYDPQKPEKTSDDLSLWHTGSDRYTSIKVADPTHYGTEQSNMATKAAARRAEKTDLFIHKGPRWTSQKILVAKTEQKMLGGNAWAGLRHDDEDVKFAFAVWANSVFGFVSHWMQTGRQQGGRSLGKIGDIEQLVCPDFTKSELKNRAQRVRRDYPDLLVNTLREANQASNDTAREEINIAAGVILGMSEKDAKQASKDLATKWCQEPSVKGTP